MKRLVLVSLSLVMVSSFFFCGFTAYTGQAYADEEIRYSMEIAPMGGVAYFDYTENIYYDYCIIEEYMNTRALPGYLSNGVNVCAVSAGGNALGYYDWDYEDLIPNHSKVSFMGFEFYGSQGAGLNAMYEDLKMRMGTTSAGTTVAGYLSGMESYVNNKSYTITQISAMSNGSLDRARYKTALQSDKLMAVFFSGFAVIPFSGLVSNAGYDKVDFSVFTGNHTMMAYGYMHIKYYNSNHVQVNELELLVASTGIASPYLSYVNVTQYGTVNDAYITYIY